MRSAAPVLAALATAALATGVTACSLRQEPSDPPVSTSSASAPPVASPLPTPVVLGETNDSDPDSVADAVAVALSVHDARTDASSQAVWTRARPLLTGDLAASVQAGGASEVERPDNRWAMMQQHQAHDVSSTSTATPTIQYPTPRPRLSASGPSAPGPTRTTDGTG